MMIKGANVVILFLFSRYFQKKKQRYNYSATIFQLWKMWFSPFIKRDNCMTFNPWMFVIHPMDVP